MKYLGQTYTKREILARCGDVSQIADAREGVLAGGKAESVKVIDVKTGGGLTFSVLPSRGLDIAWAAYNEKAIAYIGKPGVVHPAYFEPEGTGFLRSFYCGLLTTCGLTYSGATSVDEGEALGLHGRISHEPAQELCISKDWEGDDYVITIKGKMLEARVFGSRLVLSREIRVIAGENIIQLRDVVENEGFEKQPLMLLYHCNFGFPLVDAGTRLILPEGIVTKARDLAGDVSSFSRFEAPTANYAEQVFYHDAGESTLDASYAALFNERLALGAYVKFKRSELPHLVEWKMMGEGDYVVGLEPSNCYTEGRAAARADRSLEFIEAGEVRTFHLEFGIMEDASDIVFN